MLTGYAIVISPQRRHEGLLAQVLALGALVASLDFITLQPTAAHPRLMISRCTSSSMGMSWRSTRPIPHSVDMPQVRAPAELPAKVASMRATCLAVVPGACLRWIVRDARPRRSLTLLVRLASA